MGGEPAQVAEAAGEQSPFTRCFCHEVVRAQSHLPSLPLLTFCKQVNCNSGRRITVDLYTHQLGIYTAHPSRERGWQIPGFVDVDRKGSAVKIDEI